MRPPLTTAALWVSGEHRRAPRGAPRSSLGRHRARHRTDVGELSAREVSVTKSTNHAARPARPVVASTSTNGRSTCSGWRRTNVGTKTRTFAGRRRRIRLRPPDGRPTHPQLLSDAFQKLVHRSGFLRIRLHDLRHTHVTLLLKAGVLIKVVSERLGHSTPGFTMATYQHVLPGMQARPRRTFAESAESPDRLGSSTGIYPVEVTVEGHPTRESTLVRPMPVTRVDWWRGWDLNLRPSGYEVASRRSAAWYGTWRLSWDRRSVMPTSTGRGPTRTRGSVGNPVGSCDAPSRPLTAPSQRSATHGVAQASRKTRRSSNTAATSSVPPSSVTIARNTSSESAISPVSICEIALCDFPISSASSACVTPNACRSSASRYCAIS